MTSLDADIAVIGLGMIGSCALRHLADAGHRVIGIGPEEPADWATAQGPFASHFDAGRITRIIDDDATWAHLAARSLARHSEVEQRSGITFHHPVGLAWLAQDIDAALANSAQLGGDARLIEPDALLASTGIHVPQTHRQHAVWEGSPAGFINPRALVAAQVSCAVAAGATVLRHVVQSIVPTAEGVTVTHDGGSLEVGSILLATGAYGAELAGVDLGLEPRLRTTLLADVGPGEEIPTLIAEHVEPDSLTGVYWVPPTRFPDGRVLLKIGGDYTPHGIAESTDDLRRWFNSDGDPAEAAALEAALRELLPNAHIRSLDTKPCVVTATRSDHERFRWPDIGWVDDRVCVAVGGCGASAKSSDELGRLASLMVSHTAFASDDPDPAFFAPLATGAPG